MCLCSVATVCVLNESSVTLFVFKIPTHTRTTDSVSLVAPLLRFKANHSLLALRSNCGCVCVCVIFDTEPVMKWFGSPTISVAKFNEGVSVRVFDRIPFCASSISAVMPLWHFVRAAPVRAPMCAWVKAQFKRNVHEKWKNAVRLFRAVSNSHAQRTPQHKFGGENGCAKAFAFVYIWIECDVPSRV